MTIFLDTILCIIDLLKNFSLYLMVKLTKHNKNYETTREYSTAFVQISWNVMYLNICNCNSLFIYYYFLNKGSISVKNLRKWNSYSKFMTINWKVKKLNATIKKKKNWYLVLKPNNEKLRIFKQENNFSTS